VLGRSRAPDLFPEAPYELKGFFANVTFTCGLLAEGDSGAYLLWRVGWRDVRRRSIPGAYPGGARLSRG